MSIACHYIPNPFEPLFRLDVPLVPGEGFEALVARYRDPLVVVVNGVPLSPEDFPQYPAPRDGDRIVLLPVVAGNDMLRLGAMMAMMFLSPYVATVFQGVGLTFGLAHGMLTGAVMMGGALLVNAAIPVGSPDLSRESAYDFSQTTQRSGTAIPVTYGKTLVTGNVVAAWTTETNTTENIPVFSKWMVTAQDRWRTFLGKQIPSGADVSDLTHISECSPGVSVLIDCGRGPVKGFVAGSMKINSRPITDYPGVTVTSTLGTMDQASLIPGGIKREIRPMVEVTQAGGAVTLTTPNADFTSFEIGLLWDQGMWRTNSSDGSREMEQTAIKIEVSEHGAGSWQTLVDEKVYARLGKPIWKTYITSGTYTGGAPVFIVRGKQYDYRVTKGGADYASTSCNSVRIGALREVHAVPFKYPGHVLVLISGLATKDFNGSIEFEAELEGRVCDVYHSDTSTWAIEYTADPAWIARDILTGPVISGNGGGTAYAVERYDGLDPNRLDANLAAFVEWSDFCTANGIDFNATFATTSDRWANALQVAGVSRASLVREGRDYRPWVDTTTDPVYCFTANNIGRDSYTENPIPMATRAREAVGTFIHRATGYKETKLTAINTSITSEAATEIDCKGLVTLTQVDSYLKYMLAKNQYLQRTYTFAALPDACPVQSGDVAYLQANVWDWSDAARVVESTATTVTLDQDLDTGHTLTKLAVKTTGPAGDQVDVFTVASYDAGSRVVTITGGFAVQPLEGDLCIVGPSGILTKLIRVLEITRADDQKVQIDAIDYSASVYTGDTASVSTIQALGAGARALATLVSTQEKLAYDLTHRSDSIASAPVLFNGSFNVIAGGKIGWTGMKVSCLGTTYTIADETTGTTDTIVYWDSAGTTTAFAHTTTQATATGTTKWVVAYNDAGVLNHVMGAQTTVTTGQLVNESTHAGGKATSLSDLTLTTSYQDVPDAAITMTSDGTTTEVTCWASLHNTGIIAHDITLRVYNVTDSDTVIESVKNIGAGLTVRGNYNVVSDTPSSGSVTYKLQAKADVGLSTCHVHTGAYLLVKQWKLK